MQKHEQYFTSIVVILPDIQDRFSSRGSAKYTDYHFMVQIWLGVQITLPQFS
jgi:hypothetical protein